MLSRETGKVMMIRTYDNHMLREGQKKEQNDRLHPVTISELPDYLVVLSKLMLYVWLGNGYDIDLLIPKAWTTVEDGSCHAVYECWCVTKRIVKQKRTTKRKKEI